MTGADRTMARERALELLYEADAKSSSVDEVLAALPVAPDGYAVDVVTGVTEHNVEIDGLIRRLAPGWPLDRMPAVDRAVLRLGIYELSQRPDVPTAVVLDEAVELAKRYSTEESGRFVNGVLAAAAKELRPRAD
jgi:N utilization substance protein B